VEIVDVELFNSLGRRGRAGHELKPKTNTIIVTAANKKPPRFAGLRPSPADPLDFSKWKGRAGFHLPKKVRR
jgi:hypothetical protein